jgi:hypothetical protein
MQKIIAGAFVDALLDIMLNACSDFYFSRLGNLKPWEEDADAA